MAKHRIDPRIRLLQILFAAALVFVKKSEAGNILYALSIAAFLLYLGEARGALRFTLIYTLLTGAYWAMQPLTHMPAVAAVSMIVFVLRMMAPILGIYDLFAKTMRVGEFLLVLGRMRVPKAIVIPLAVALRFFPTINQEVGQIRDALRIRNRPLTVLSFLRSPLEMMEYVMVPLMMRCIKIADELSASAVARGIENPLPRTSILVLHIGGRDIVFLLLSVVMLSLPWLFDSAREVFF